MFARIFLNSVPIAKNNFVMITRSQLKNNIPSRFLKCGTEYVVHHDKKKKFFFIDLGGEQKAFIQYNKLGKIYNLVHTSVPKEFEGRGIGKLLACNVFVYIKENNLKMRLLCGFLNAYMLKYAPEYKIYIAD